MRDASNAVEKYRLTPKQLDGSSTAMSAALKSAIDRKEWIVAMAWAAYHST